LIATLIERPHPLQRVDRGRRRLRTLAAICITLIVSYESDYDKRKDFNLSVAIPLDIENLAVDTRTDIPNATFGGKQELGPSIARDDL
jgi:hypothetical protein